MMLYREFVIGQSGRGGVGLWVLGEGWEGSEGGERSEEETEENKF